MRYLTITIALLIAFAGSAPEELRKLGVLKRAKDRPRYDFNNPVDPEASNYQGYPSNPPSGTPAPTVPPAAPGTLTLWRYDPDPEHGLRVTWPDNAADEEGFHAPQRGSVRSRCFSTLRCGTLVPLDRVAIPGSSVDLGTWSLAEVN